MKSAHQQRIEQFMAKAGQLVPQQPLIPDGPTRVLRARLIMEEALETISALGVDVYDKEGLCDLEMDHLDFVDASCVDLAGVADGCADISVVTIGTLSAFGLDDTELLEEVDRANLRKFGPGSYKRPSDGKWMKPPDWQPPDILQAIFIKCQ